MSADLLGRILVALCVLFLVALFLAAPPALRLALLGVVPADVKYERPCELGEGK